MKGIFLTNTSLVILAFIFLFIISVSYAIYSARSKKKPNQKKIKKLGQKNSLGVCPICATKLEPNENVITAIYPGKDDRLCYIYGCPNCYPMASSKTIRYCPVCKKEIDTDVHLIARYFVRKDSAERIHILGCSNCKF